MFQVGKNIDDWLHELNATRILKFETADENMQDPKNKGKHSHWIVCNRFFLIFNMCSLCKKNSIHQANTMLASSKNVLFPGHFQSEG